MNRYRKILAILAVLVLAACVLAGCSKAEPVDVRVAALKGPTAMGMVSFMEKADSGKYTDNKYSFQLMGAVDEVSPLLVKGDIDIAALPANLASVLFNNTDGGVEVLAVNTLGVLYIVENGSAVSSVEDLRGRKIYASGKGATPEYALNYILKGNQIDPDSDVTIEWKSEHAECLAALMEEEGAIAMLPQPFITTAQTKSDKVRVALDLNAEWDKLQKDSENPSGLITGVVVARKEFARNNPDAVEMFLKHYLDSVEFVNTNNSEAAALIGSYGIVPEEVAKKAIPACNIVYITGKQMKEILSGYLETLFEQNPKAVGGALPTDGFYYGAD
ncbi:MAG: ABC transporter substrate-binding protein [Lachnospiraceae bacterium]|nr:ABC transporter substrate-binding protein [Lachnospiraceae bacterium]